MNRLMMGAKAGAWIILTALMVALLAVVGCSDSPDGPEEHPVVQYPELAGKRTVYREVIDPPEAAPDWKLIDHDGQPMSLSDDLAGRVVVLSFAYSRCPDVCPLLLAHFLTIQKDLRELIDDRVSLVIITVDPEFDTPQRLAQYTDAMNGRWHFLSGTRPELEKAWEDYDIHVLVNPQDVVEHSYKVFVIDENGMIRHRYGGLFSTKEATEDIRNLLGPTTGLKSAAERGPM